jgi:pyrroloquinoline quinone biosynthesis protein B
VLQELTPEVRGELDGACLLVDGTCWSDDELIRLGCRPTAREMGAPADQRPGGSLEQLARLPVERRIYVHVNNTNTILLEDAHRAAHRRGARRGGRRGRARTGGVRAPQT